MMYGYIFFDLDGTLNDSAQGILNACIYAMKKGGLAVPDRDALFKFIGPPLEDSFQEYYGVSEKRAWELVDEYRDYYLKKGAYENSVYDGVFEMLETLKAQGRRLVIATSKPYEITVDILKHFDLLDYFDYVGAATLDGSIGKKKDVIAHTIKQLGLCDRSDILMIGDRDQDVYGAKENGLDFLGALYGYGGMEELCGAGAKHFVSSVSQIVQKIAELEKAGER